MSCFPRYALLVQSAGLHLLQITLSSSDKNASCSYCKTDAQPFILLFPLAYLVMGYIMTVIGCALYNFVSRYTGGIEFEVSSDNV
jgi:hypothetical protein